MSRSARTFLVAVAAGVLGAGTHAQAQFVWVKQGGADSATSYNTGRAIAADPDGNFLVTGTTNSSPPARIRFDAATSAGLSLTRAANMFLVKYSANGAPGVLANFSKWLV